MATGSQGREIHVLLKLHDGERSFGMSLAQRSPTLGPKYTVVSSVFANSPADRAGVRKGYVVRCINDKPMGGLTVAQVANHFRNVGQAKITLEIVESAVSPRSTAFTAAVTFGGVATLPNRPTTQTAGANGAQRSTTPVTGFSAVSSGRAIAAPGSALAVPTVAAPKQPVLRLGAKPAAKALGLRPESGPGSSVSAGMVTFADASMPSADAKTAGVAKHTGLKSNVVAPVLRLGLKSKPAQPEITAEKVAATTTSVAPKTARSTHSPIVPTQAPTAPKTGKTGKKRGRPRKNPAASNGTASAKGKGKGKAKKAPKHQPEDAEVDAIMDDEDVFDYYAFTPDSDVEESPSTKSGPRTPKTRRRSNTDRTRHSLTVDRLVGMGFTQEDAEASVKEIGDDPDACMVWIISKIEERNFNEDLNRASIQSEQSKRDEEKRMKKREEETLVHTEKFMTLFPTVSRTCWSLLDAWMLRWEPTT
ncbi:hypothetical protein PHPALM_12244 [Phytophthora palmivora]|uniref:PDZ domain-containing protein n=1 Tax=Phytophthora palmivora TaxID=4796 RepID=A0A2P4Y072_9STRA|nr:hypothetical protein PHPALM_12244 [Phytophthora palmivora]